MNAKKQWKLVSIWLGLLASAAALLLVIGAAPAFAQSKGGSKPSAQKPTGNHTESVLADQAIPASTLAITVTDDTQMRIVRPDTGDQFYGQNAEGVYLWVNVGGVTKVFGPAHVPAGNDANPYTPVSNSLSGTGAPADPYKVTTVVNAPGTPLQLTQVTSYVTGAEFTSLTFSLKQISGSVPVTATLFHAADLFTNGSDSGYGYRDSSSHSIGDVVTNTTTGTLYQQFVPNANTLPSAYQEGYYNDVWAAIGDTSGRGTGFNNTLIADMLHDSGAGLQWNLNVPASGSVSVGDVDLFSPQAQLCGSFSDVHASDFYYHDVAYLACNGYVSGYIDTTFRPQNDTTRGQLSKIIVLGQHWAFDTSGGPHFTDVPTTNPYYQYIETAFHHNAISGYADHTFRWGADVTRGQIAKIIVTARGWTINTSGGPHFTDVPTNSTFYNYIETARSKGVISGYSDNTFHVGNSATRGQLSKIVHLSLTTSK